MLMAGARSGGPPGFAVTGVASSVKARCVQELLLSELCDSLMFHLLGASNASPHCAEQRHIFIRASEIFMDALQGSQPKRTPSGKASFTWRKSIIWRTLRCRI